MKWNKKGFIFSPTGEFEWSKCYAQVPTPIELDDRVRVFFTTRGEPQNGLFKSYTTFVDLNKENLKEQIYIHDSPIIELGAHGAFDEFGFMPGSIIKRQNTLLLYYTGWLREQSVPYNTSIGCVFSDNEGKSFSRVYSGPILGKNIYDPFLVNGPYVILVDNIYHMWYSSCYKWVGKKIKNDPVYKIKHATSLDGIKWNVESDFCISERITNEAQNAPCVYRLGDIYYMMFCYRESIDFRLDTKGYHLDYAISKDLKTWERMSDLTLSGINEEWDSDMQAYPRVLSMDDKFYLFYNGNDFGKCGFGYAELEL